MLARRPLAENGRAEVQARLGTSYRVFSWGSSVWFVRQVRGEDRPSLLPNETLGRVCRRLVL